MKRYESRIVVNDTTLLVYSGYSKKDALNSIKDAKKNSIKYEVKVFYKYDGEDITRVVDYQF